MLDTIQDNSDRHARNVLIEPSEDGLVSLWYIDHEFSKWSEPGENDESVEPRLPHAPLNAYVTSEEEFAPFLLMAEGLHVDKLADAFAEAPVAAWTGEPAKARAQARLALRRAQCVRASLQRSLGAFPRLQRGAA